MRRRIILIAMFFALTAIGGEPVVLLTGFQAVKEAKTNNSSWEIIRSLQGRTIAGHRVETLQLPYVYDAVELPLKEAIAKFKPAAVICFGDCARGLRIEREAKNSYHETKRKDHNGLPPPREKIVPDGKDAIPTGLPLDAIYEELRTDFFVPILSEVSEGSVANECFYRLMSLPEAPAARGMVMLPEIDSTDPAAGGGYTREKMLDQTTAIVSLSVGRPPVRILAVGDGYVNAFQASKDRWVTMLAERMRESVSIVRDPMVLAHETYTVGETEKAIKRTGEQRFDYVFIQVGARDHIDGIATRNFSIEKLLKSAKEFKDAKIVVLAIPDFTVSQFGKTQGYNSELSRKKLREFNAILLRETEEAGALFVDITPDTVQFGEDKKMQSYDIYYAPKMYELWAERVYSTLKAKKLLPK